MTNSAGDFLADTSTAPLEDDLRVRTHGRQPDLLSEMALPKAIEGGEITRPEAYYGRMRIGPCKLCERIRELQESHLIASGFFPLMADGSGHPPRVGSEKQGLSLLE
jgi:hypothetical protein